MIGIVAVDTGQGGTKLKFSTAPDGPVEIFFTGPLKIFTGPPFSNEL